MRLTAVLVFVALTTAAATSSQVGDSISVDSGRPLGEVIKTFQAKYGWAITYEDPPFRYSGDIRDVTDAVAKGSSRRRITVPRGGRFTVSFPVPPPESTASEVVALISKFVEEYHSSGYPGRFRVFSTGRMIHIVPTSIRGPDGVQVSLSSILDVRISLPARKHRSAFDAIQDILNILRDSTGQQMQIEVGTVPINLLRQSEMESAVLDEPARNVLEQVLSTTGAGLSWRLLYGPDVARYALNIAVVTKKRSE